MVVPKASMDEDDRLLAGQYDIGAAGKVAPMQPEAVAEAVKQPPYGQFRRCVAALDSPHHFGLGERHRLGPSS